MALIFPRIARNFIKNGYFPTDEPTLKQIATAIDLHGHGDAVRIIDPCCGEGGALLHMQDHLQECGAQVQSYGIDIDEERAWHAKTVLGTVAHADVHDVRIADRSFGLLFLNPPYGDLVSDGAQTGDKSPERERHEKVFCRRTFNLLQVGGVLVLVVPFYTLDREMATFIARHFERVEVFMSGAQVFKQCVLFGVKRKPTHPDAATVQRLLSFGQGIDQKVLPEHWALEPYLIPAIKPADDFHFTVIRLDAKQLAYELSAGLAKASLWPRFDQLMRRHSREPKRPLRAMSDWHLALALAAGQISGVVTSSTGRRLLIKGSTHKAKDSQVVHETHDDGTVAETRVMTDKFVTVIRAIDLTPGPGLGQVVTIA